MGYPKDRGFAFANIEGGPALCMICSDLLTVGWAILLWLLCIYWISPDVFSCLVISKAAEVLLNVNT